MWQARAQRVILNGCMVAPNLTVTPPLPMTVTQGCDLNARSTWDSRQIEPLGRLRF